MFSMSPVRKVWIKMVMMAFVMTMMTTSQMMIMMVIMAMMMTITVVRMTRQISWSGPTGRD